MTLIADLKALSKPQRAAIWASYLGWTLDAFDFFLMVFMLSAIATEFGTDIKAVSVAIFLTLAARPFGALFFGLLADKFGRRPLLLIDATQSDAEIGSTSWRASGCQNGEMPV